MPSFIECPTCSRRLRVPDGLQVQDVQCPSCGTTFPTGVETGQVTTTPPSEPGRIEASSPFRVCPFCREDVPREEVRCRYCGEAVDEEEGAIPHSGTVRRDAEPHRGKVLLALGIVSLVLSGLYGLALLGIPLGLTVWLLGRRDLRLMRTEEMDPQGAVLTRAGNACGLVGIVLGGIWLIAFTLVFLIEMSI